MSLSFIGLTLEEITTRLSVREFIDHWLKANFGEVCMSERAKDNLQMVLERNVCQRYGIKKLL